MPELAAGQSRALVTRWFKQVGDRVRAGEVLLEVETEKVNSELEAPADGVVTEILAQEGDEVEVGAVIARFAAAAAPGPDRA